jgi:hypothetical protein
LTLGLMTFAGSTANAGDKAAGDGKPACDASATPVALAADKQGGKDIVDTAVAAGKFNTLAAALKAAGLVDTLKGEGPFTVFAPTDEAFAKLPKGAGRGPAQAGEQGEAQGRPDLPRRAGQGEEHRPEGRAGGQDRQRQGREGEDQRRQGTGRRRQGHQGDVARATASST